jgi:phytoene dehydrogenase-like protein
MNLPPRREPGDPMPEAEVLIVGAGLAGLACARALHAQGVGFQILEASDAPGGRVRTDRQDGFLLDRGFQVLLTAYPEALRQLDYDALRLRPFYPGAMVRHEGRFYRMSDPWREPGSVLSGLFCPVGTFADKFRLAKLRRHVLGQSVDEILASVETSTLQELRQRGFSRLMIDRFFKPFIGGVTLDPKLGVSSRMFEFAFRMFAEGDAALPADGMHAIPDQLAAGLPPGSILTHQRVGSVGPGLVTLETGESLKAEAVVIATEGAEAARLLGAERQPPSRGVVCYYFSAKDPPVADPILVLSGSTRGPINNLAVMNLVAPTYAPPGENLVSVTVVGVPSRDEQALLKMVRNQLKRWYGLVAEEWPLLRVYRLERALPAVFPLEVGKTPRLEAGLYVCGDHKSTPSIQGALESGRLAAEALIGELRPEPARQHQASAG